MKRKLKVLNFLIWYKNLYENITKQELSLCQQSIKELQRKKKEVERDIVEEYEKIAQRKILDGREITNYFLEIQNLTEIKKRIEKEVLKKEREKEQLLEVLRGRYKERRLVEILRDKVEELWMKEEERRFFNEMNEIVLLLRTNREREGF